MIYFKDFGTFYYLYIYHTFIIRLDTFYLTVYILMATIESINIYSRISLEGETWQSLFEKGKICEEKNDKAEAVLYYQLSLKYSQKMNGTNSLECV